MPYDGETTRIKITVDDFDDQPVTNVQVISAIVNLYDSVGNFVFTNVALTWSSVNKYWYYDWPAALPGTFLAQGVFTGAGFEVFGYGTVRVKPLKIIPTGNPTPIVGQEDNNGG